MSTNAKKTVSTVVTTMRGRDARGWHFAGDDAPTPGHEPVREGSLLRPPVRVPLLVTLPLVLAACSALESYSVRVAEQSCDDVLVCTVYGDRGKVESPCISTGRDTIYPGDPRWPYTTPGVCDAVRDGKVISTRATGSTAP